MKRNKAAGPDEIPIELFKEMNDENLQSIQDIIKTWWEEQERKDKAGRGQGRYSKERQKWKGSGWDRPWQESESGAS